MGVRSITVDLGGRGYIAWVARFGLLPTPTQQVVLSEHPIPAPGDESVVGVDCGVAVSAALSTGELLHAP